MAYGLSEPTGTDVVAWSDSPETAYWRRHPDVIDAVSVPRMPADGDQGYDVQLWLRSAPDDPAADPPRQRTPRPKREHDLELFARGELHSDFAARLPDAEHIEVYVELDWHEACPESWWVIRIWLPDGVSAAQDS
ncbi:MAG TPA: hypothetical protein VH353_02405 [Caulobacteraceae bacterium]|nr:hypothetical protein [Caulobacteraceae bacterium]